MNTEKYYKILCSSCGIIWIIEDTFFDKSPGEIDPDDLGKNDVILYKGTCKKCKKEIEISIKDIQGPFSKQEIEAELKKQPPPPKFFWEGEKV